MMQKTAEEWFKLLRTDHPVYGNLREKALTALKERPFHVHSAKEMYENIALALFQSFSIGIDEEWIIIRHKHPNEILIEGWDKDSDDDEPVKKNDVEKSLEQEQIIYERTIYDGDNYEKTYEKMREKAVEYAIDRADEMISKTMKNTANDEHVRGSLNKVKKELWTNVYMDSKGAFFMGEYESKETAESDLKDMGSINGVYVKSVKVYEWEEDRVGYINIYQWPSGTIRSGNWVWGDEMSALFNVDDKDGVASKLDVKPVRLNENPIKIIY